MSDYLVTDIELSSIADAIRTKGGTSASLNFPTGFVNAIRGIPTGNIKFGVMRSNAELLREVSDDYLYVADAGHTLPAFSTDLQVLYEPITLSYDDGRISCRPQYYNYYYTVQLMIYPIFSTQTSVAGRPDGLYYSQVTELRGTHVITTPISGVQPVAQRSSFALNSSSDNIYAYVSGDTQNISVASNKEEGLWLVQRLDTNYSGADDYVWMEMPRFQMRGTDSGSSYLTEAGWNLVTDFRVQYNVRAWRYEKDNTVTDGWSHYMLMKNIIDSVNSDNHTLTPPAFY